ncbi:Boron transporter 1 [Fulvia fulva]|nr:Boron transporter 1 [Fulvia fulva]WPV15665.1 Boron transporter 1 [Fulvia fulva]WPV29434.1 Boron transporter 1 [Fulvia fulva]
MSGPERKSSYLSNALNPFRRKDGLLRPGRLLHQDLKNYTQRWPSDWTIFNQLIFASVVYLFFTNLLPGITFASDLYNLTGQSWGAIEIVFSTGLCGVIFSIFSVQPLTILGVAGPFSVLAENIYALCENSFQIDFLSFMAWTLIHAGWMHILLAVLNAHDWTMLYVTEFSCEVFSLLNSIIYFHKALQELERAHARLDMAAFLYAIIGAWPPIFHRYVRMGLKEYAAAISIIFFIGIPYAGELAQLDKDTLYTSKDAFRPSKPERDHFYAAAAMIPGAIITMLFFFDHEISSIICTIKRYGTKKPTGYAQDIVVLGLTTALCGVLGIPPANGLLPQAPLHSESLMHDFKGEYIEEEVVDRHGVGRIVQRPVQGVYEQRWSYFIHAAAILVFIAPPLQHVLGLAPTSVLAGLFIFMGQQSLSVNPILHRTFWILTPASELPPLPQGIRNWWAVHTYTLFEIVMAVVVFIVTLTVAGPAFPVIIVALVPFRLLVMHRIWNKDVLRYVDRWACREGRPEDEEEGADGDAGLDGLRAEDTELRVDGRDIEKGPVEHESVGASSAVDGLK